MSILSSSRMPYLLRTYIGSLIPLGILSLLMVVLEGFLDDPESLSVFCSNGLFNSFEILDSFGFGGICGLEEAETGCLGDDEEDVSTRSCRGEPEVDVIT